ncbi:MAG: divalent metal cation transporter [Sphingomonas bacterium]|uniref:NRAMP family divalent metal transporter n=1 Tax=Sphingomonas bacterium TaxID=1895847 RepID=UPI002620A470|nr:divalent metal cation transporter [Sphingomonas bacterium]MDB5706345.1 divalent metal cation transporter [Sphingomonas bacterium]
MKLGQRARSIALAKQLGPGLVTGAADDDPSGIATYSQAGAQFGFGLLWTLVLTYPLMTAVQLVSARIGRVTDAGLARNMAKILPGWIVTGLVALLFIANTINIGADLAAMGEAAQLVLGWGDHVFTAGFAIVSLLLQMFVPYRRYSNILKWLTLVLLAYVALVFMVKVDWAAAGWGMIWPTIAGTTAITTVVAIFGTTISPYLFFWQSSQEVEEVDQDDHKHALNDAPEEAPEEFRRISLDTFTGMAVSNLVALAIMIGTAATLHAAGKTDIQSAADAASALKPVAGQFAFLLFSLGIIGTGLLAIPVLAGSTAYAIGESRGWTTGLEHKPWEAKGFYTVIGVATLLGIGLDWSPIDPIRALFWSAVINGVVAVPIMAVMMIVVSLKSTMGAYTASMPLRFFGWTATAVMAAAAVAMVVV